MHVYDIYKDSKDGCQAIKSGFSFPGLLLAWAWTFSKKMTTIATCQCVVWFLFLFLSYSFWNNLGWLHIFDTLADISLISSYVFKTISICFLCCIVLLHLYVGVFGNTWLRNKWASWGYERMNNVLAVDPQTAIAEFSAEKKESSAE